MGKSSRGVPQKIQERSNSVAVGALQTQHRVRALVDQALDVFNREAAAGKRDPAQRIVDDFYEIPPLNRPEYMAQLLKLAGITPGQAQPGAQGNGISFNFNGLFAGAAAVAAKQQGDDAVIIEGDDGVQSGYDDRQPTDW